VNPMSEFELSGPGVALIGGKRVLEHGVGEHLTAVMIRCLLPHGVEIASFVNRHRREIPPVLFDEPRFATGRSTQFKPLGSLTLGIGGQTPPGNSADQNPVQQRIIVDDENMLTGVGRRRIGPRP